MISIISTINNEKIAKEFLLRGLSRQNAKFELFLVDNRAFSYKSACQANNRAGLKASGDYLMFIHQDVLLLSRNWLKQAEDWLSTFSKIGVAGVAGMMKPKLVNEFELCMRYCLLQKLGMLHLWFRHYGRGNVFHGPEMLPWGGSFISDVVSVQTIDELLLIIPNSVFKSTKFDETVCDDWHLYGVDFSLTVSKKGLNNYVLPCSVFHRSTGKITDPYLRTLKRLIKKHKNEKAINTTSGLCLTRKELMELLWLTRSKKLNDLIEARFKVNFQFLRGFA
jgi:hypothetical protein